jgi:undecaprenyl-diphosphatase
MQALIIFGAKYLFIFVVLLAAYVWWRLPKDKRGQVAAQAAIGLGVATILVKIMGAWHPTLRPFVEHHFMPLFPQRGDNGFPSDHTTFTMLAAFTILPFARRWGWSLAGLALVVGLCRVAAGVHSLQDIAGGIGVAALSASISYYVAQWIAKTWQQKTAK